MWKAWPLFWVPTLCTYVCTRLLFQGIFPCLIISFKIRNWSSETKNGERLPFLNLTCLSISEPVWIIHQKRCPRAKCRSQTWAMSKKETRATTGAILLICRAWDRGGWERGVWPQSENKFLANGYFKPSFLCARRLVSWSRSEGKTDVLDLFPPHFSIKNVSSLRARDLRIERELKARIWSVIRYSRLLLMRTALLLDCLSTLWIRCGSPHAPAVSYHCGFAPAGPSAWKVSWTIFISLQPNHPFRLRRGQVTPSLLWVHHGDFTLPYNCPLMPLSSL